MNVSSVLLDEDTNMEACAQLLMNYPHYLPRKCFLDAGSGIRLYRLLLCDRCDPRTKLLSLLCTYHGDNSAVYLYIFLFYKCINAVDIIRANLLHIL